VVFIIYSIGINYVNCYILCCWKLCHYTSGW